MSKFGKNLRELQSRPWRTKATYRADLEEQKATIGGELVM